MRRLLLVAILLLSGCTAETTRIALKGQQRADDVQQTIIDRQQEGLKIYLYQKTVADIQALGPFTDAQRAVFLKAWQERDLVEFWGVQNERAKALRLITVDAKLYADQGILNLLWKALEIAGDRIKTAAAADVGSVAGQKLLNAVQPTPTTNP